MTYNEVKSMLKNLNSKKSRLKSLQAYITEERTIIEGVGAVMYDKLAVEASHGNSTEARYIKYLDRLKDLQERFDVLMEDMYREEELINRLMKKLSPIEYEVILNRFLRGINPRKTAKLMGYSLDGLYDVQSRAINKMCEN